jgi:glyoxylate/hydroxypyruvate reductase A
MAIVLISEKSNKERWQKALKLLLPDLNVGFYPNDSNREEVDFALVWHPPLGVFKNYPNLKVIASTGAGVDHILKDPNIPEGVIITRVVDIKLTNDMSNYLIAQVMNHIRNIAYYRLEQQEMKWSPKPYLDDSKIQIGIMGMGELGQDVANKLKHLGLNVHGWARSKKDLSNIKVFAGSNEFTDFLSQSDILICLLPLTKETFNILNKDTFSSLPSGAYVINVARGEHLVVDDLIEALDSGKLSGACLDVFREEPLPNDHVFWTHPKISITPHVASITIPESVASQIIENYKKMIKGELLLNSVSRSAGY